MSHEVQPRRLNGVSAENPNVELVPFKLMSDASAAYSWLRNAQIEGEHLPRSGHALLAIGPHTYWADPIIVNWAVMEDAKRTIRLISIEDAVNPDVAEDSAIRQIDYLAALPKPIRELVTSTIVRMYDPLPVQRPTVNRRFTRKNIEFIRELDESIIKGRLIGLFVEESDKENDLSTIKPGAAHIALKYPDLPVYPVGIVNANGSDGFRNLKVRIGKPFTARGLRAENPNLNRQNLTQHIANAIADLIGISHPIIARGRE